MAAFSGHPPRPADSGTPVERLSSPGPAMVVLRSGDLFGKAREILIEHGGSFYRLRVTQSNKLILTK